MDLIVVYEMEIYIMFGVFVKVVNVGVEIYNWLCLCDRMSSFVDCKVNIRSFVYVVLWGFEVVVGIVGMLIIKYWYVGCGEMILDIGVVCVLY